MGITTMVEGAEGERGRGRSRRIRQGGRGIGRGDLASWAKSRWAGSSGMSRRTHTAWGRMEGSMKVERKWLLTEYTVLLQSRMYRYLASR